MQVYKALKRKCHVLGFLVFEFPLGFMLARHQSGYKMEVQCLPRHVPRYSSYFLSQDTLVPPPLHSTRDKVRCIQIESLENRKRGLSQHYTAAWFVADLAQRIEELVLA